MTEPDPIAALAAQLEELRGQLARYTGETGHLRARLERAPARSWCSGSRSSSSARSSKRRPASGRPMTRRRRSGWACPRMSTRPGSTELRAWVEQVGLVQYQGYFAKLPPCWPAHPEAVMELSTVMTEWVRIYGDPDNGLALCRTPSSGPRQAWLPGCPRSAWATAIQVRLSPAAACDEVLAVGADHRHAALHLIVPRRPRPRFPGVRGLLREYGRPGQGMITGCPFPCSPTGRSGARSVIRWRRGSRSASAGRHACAPRPGRPPSNGRGMGHLWIWCGACHEEGRETMLYEPPHDPRTANRARGARPARAPSRPRRRSRPAPRSDPARRQAARRPPRTAQPGARVPPARQWPPGSSQRVALPAPRPAGRTGPPWR